MKSFFNTTFHTDKSPEEIIDFMKSITLHACDQRKNTRAAEFRGYIWQKSFMVWKNSSYRNSFRAVAKVNLNPAGNSTEVNLSVGMSMPVFAIMCIWCVGVLFFGIEMTYYLLTDNTVVTPWAPVAILSLFILMAYIFLRLVFYNSFRKLRERMLEILS